MPTKKPRPSGAEYKRRRKAAEQAKLIEHAKTIGLTLSTPGRKLPDLDAAEADNSAADFDCLGMPDLSDPSTTLEYVRRAQLIAFAQICHSRRIDEATRWRLIKEHSAVVGMTHPRAKLESDFKKLKADQAAPVPTEAKETKKRGIARPPTARGAGAAGGSGAVSRPLPDPDAPTDG